MPSRIELLFFLLVLSLALSPPAYAYLDPGSGSYIFQLLLATLVGLLFALRMFWGRIKLFVKKIFSGSASDEHDTKQ